MARRTATGLALLALSAMWLLAAPATGSTGAGRGAGSIVVGQNFESQGHCPSSTTALQASSGDGTDYTVRTPGVLTSFSTIMSGGFRALALRPATADQYTLVGAAPLRLATSLSTPTTVPVRIPVLPGDVRGIDLPAETTGCAVNTGDAADQVKIGSFSSATEFVATGMNPGQRINLSAVLEPDADGDGYGDVSQDGCPALASLQVPCPTPDTKVKHKPPAVVHHAVVRFKIKSTVPGSTFECSSDGGRFKTCKASFKKKFSLDRHKVKVRAVSPLGFADATPAKVKFRVESS
jgi:hypothetical protein